MSTGLTKDDFTLFPETFPLDPTGLGNPDFTQPMQFGYATTNSTRSLRCNTNSFFVDNFRVDILAFVPAPEPGCTIEPQTATLRVQDANSHTVTMTATVGGEPIDGTPVTFTVTSGPNASETHSSQTDANGQASFTYASGGELGTDLIAAAGAYQGEAFSCTAQVTWVDNLPPIAVDDVGILRTLFEGGAVSNI